MIEDTLQKVSYFYPLPQLKNGAKQDKFSSCTKKNQWPIFLTVSSVLTFLLSLLLPPFYIEDLAELYNNPKS